MCHCSYITLLTQQVNLATGSFWQHSCVHTRNFSGWVPLGRWDLWVFSTLRLIWLWEQNFLMFLLEPDYISNTVLKKAQLPLHVPCLPLNSNCKKRKELVSSKKKDVGRLLMLVDYRKNQNCFTKFPVVAEFDCCTNKAITAGTRETWDHDGHERISLSFGKHSLFLEPGGPLLCKVFFKKACN